MVEEEAGRVRAVEIFMGEEKAAVGGVKAGHIKHLSADGGPSPPYPRPDRPRWVCVLLAGCHFQFWVFTT